MNNKKILLLFGGGSTEHEISKVSAGYLESILADVDQYSCLKLELTKNKELVDIDNNLYRFIQDKHTNTAVENIASKQVHTIDYVIPIMHGYPTETGDIQSYLKILNLPFWSADSEAHQICFNKMLTKLVLENFQIKTTPALYMHNDYHNDQKSIEVLKDFHKKHDQLFIKASNQGSSIGCYKISSNTGFKDIQKTLEEAFSYGEVALVEKCITGRELEVAVYDFEDSTHISDPGEICVPDGFYDYQQKYEKQSNAVIHVKAPKLNPEQICKIKNMALKAYKITNLKHIARIDFFLTNEGEILINEINSMPGMTPISLFPKMVEANGHKFKDVLQWQLKQDMK